MVVWDIYIAGEWFTRCWYMGYMQHLLNTKNDIMIEEIFT